MQDGRCTLEPRATRTLLRVDGNEKDVTRTRGMSNRPEKENGERKGERVRVRGRRKRKKCMEEERGNTTRRKRATKIENER